jgi:putative nucleotidyltransferase with HDIG domain
MRQVEVSKLRPGMVAAADIITKRGQVIAEKGSEMTGQLIARLSFYRIETVSIEDEASPIEVQPAPAPEPTPAPAPAPTPAPAPEPAPAPKSFTPPPVAQPSLFQDSGPEPDEQPDPPRRGVHATIPDNLGLTNALSMDHDYQQLQIIYARTLASLRDNFNALLDGEMSDMSMEELLSQSKDLFQSRSTIELFDLLRGLRSNDDVIYAHCLNVAMVARALGKWLRFSKQDLDILTLAGLLHDIGKMLVPMDILSKTEKLTPEEFAKIKEHPMHGFNILKKIPNLDQRIVKTALQHHERCDGSGYPRGLTGDETDDYAEIIAIADVYDAMTAIRAYRSPKCAFEVISDFERDGLQKYNPKYVLTFLEHIANYYQNSKVILSDGERVDIIYINQSALSRPMVKYDDGRVVDLSHERNLSIVSTM